MPRRRVEARQAAREEATRAAIAEAPVTYEERDDRVFVVRHLPMTVDPVLRRLGPDP
jgi:hypothetical protein